MKKIISAVVLSCAIVFGLSACGGGSPASSAAGTDGVSSESRSVPSLNASSGNLYDTGAFTLEVPSGWLALPQTDMLADTDENGSLPASATSLSLIKGGTDESDEFSKPTIYINLFEGDAGTQAEMSVMFYDETKDLDVSINGTACRAFEAKTPSLSEEDKFYVYDMVFYPVSETQFFQFNIPVDMVDFEGVSIEDADVKAIMESVRLK